MILFVNNWYKIYILFVLLMSKFKFYYYISVKHMYCTFKMEPSIIVINGSCIMMIRCWSKRICWVCLYNIKTFYLLKNGWWMKLALNKNFYQSVPLISHWGLFFLSFWVCTTKLKKLLYIYNLRSKLKGTESIYIIIIWQL